MSSDPILEVFSVDIVCNQIKDITCADIEGSIVADDFSDDRIHIFESREGSSLVFPNGKLALTGPVRYPRGYDVGIKLLLKEKHRKLEISDSYLSVGWGYDRFRFRNKPFSAVAKGKDGYAVVHYMMYQGAGPATVEISLGDDVDVPCELVGFIRARSDLYQFDGALNEKDFWIYLFHTSEENPELLEVGTKNLPLMRSCVAVPSGYNIIIEAQLSDGTCNIATGSASFERTLYGSSYGAIGGIKVEVKWETRHGGGS